MAIWSFICKVCGPSTEPCDHAMLQTELKILREIREEDRIAFKFIEGALKDILHNQNRPQSATLTISILSGGTSVPKTVSSGGTGQAAFHEWTGPTGTGTELPLAGAVTWSSDNASVATVDPASGLITSVGPDGVANISGVDAANNLTASDVFTVNTAPPPPVAQSATVTIT